MKTFLAWLFSAKGQQIRGRDRNDLVNDTDELNPAALAGVCSGDGKPGGVDMTWY